MIKLLNFMEEVLDEVLQSLLLRNSKLDHLNGYFWLLESINLLYENKNVLAHIT